MAIELVTRYSPYVDELFTTESKTSILTNKDFDFIGAKTVKVYKVGTAEMNDYGRNASLEGGLSRYGVPTDLTAETEAFTLTKDRSFTFVVDKLDEDETGNALNPASALARQLREVVVPEVDSYTLQKIIAGAGTTPEAAELTAENIYDKIVSGTNALDNAEVPETGRVLVITPDTYLLMKKCDDIVLETETGANMRITGVIGNLDGMTVLKVPAARLPQGFGFAIVHPSATVGVEKLADYSTHINPPGINGALVEGRICYDAFVLENKTKAIYYQAKTVEQAADPTEP